MVQWVIAGYFLRVSVTKCIKINYRRNEFIISKQHLGTAARLVSEHINCYSWNFASLHPAPGTVSPGEIKMEILVIH